MEASSDVTLSTIEAMKVMAQDPNKREALIKDDACMGGLVMVLSNQDDNIAASALETLCLLAECPNHRTHMKTFIGMMEQLSALAYRPSQKIQELAERAYNLLEGTSKPSHSGPLQDKSNQRQVQRDAAHRKQNLFGGKTYKTKVIVLQISGLKSKDDIELCKNCLLRVKGVVSITFDMQKRRAVLRCKPEIKAETLAMAVAKSATMSAEQVIKDGAGNEILQTLCGSSPVAGKENLKLPDYPPSDEDDDTDYSGHPARPGAAKNSSGGWDYLHKIGSFLSNSFYW